MKNIFNKLKKTISFYVLILSMLFFLVSLVLKCIYIYNYTHVSGDIEDCMKNGTKYVTHTYFGESYSESFDADRFKDNIVYIDYYTKTMLNMQKKDYTKYYNDIPTKIIKICILCFFISCIVCYIKIHPKKEIMRFFLSKKNTLRCPACGGYADKRDGYTMCFKCNRKLITEDEYYSRGIPAAPTVECPYCHSTNTKKISTFERVFSTEFLGLGSSKVGKQWHCNKCNSDF